MLIELRCGSLDKTFYEALTTYREKLNYISIDNYSAEVGIGDFGFEKYFVRIITANNCRMTTRKLSGIVLSIVSMCLEKRLTMRPRGVMSNISIGQRIVPRSRTLGWIVLRWIVILQQLRRERRLGDIN